MIFLFLLNACSAFSNPTPTFLDFIRTVEKHYPLMTVSEQEVIGAEGELKSSLGAFDLTLKNKAKNTFEGYYKNQSIETVLEKPTSLWGISGYAGYRLSQGTYPAYEKGETLSQGETFLGVDIPLLRNGPIDRKRATLAKSEIGVQAAQESKRLQQIELFRQATQKYWETIAHFKRKDIVQNLLKNSTDRNEQLLERVKHGDIAKFEQFENERAILNRQAQLVQAERQLSASIQQLSLFFRDDNGNPKLISTQSTLGDSVLNPFQSIEPLENVSLVNEQMIDGALKMRPDILRLTKQGEQNQVEVNLANNQFLPKLDIQLQYSKDFGSGSSALIPQETVGMLSLEIPIQWRVFSGRLTQATSQQIRLDAQTQLLRERIKTEVGEALINLKAASDRIGYTSQELELARKLEKGEYDRFKSGDSQLLLVNLREQQTADAALKQIDAFLDHHLAIAAYHAVTGNLAYWSKH